MATGTIVDVVMPQMGVSVSEGTVSRWLKAEGETVEKDETLLEISTDKVDTEVPSPASGVVSQILAQEGDTLDVGEKLCVIEVGGEAGPAATNEINAEDTPAASPPVSEQEAAQAPPAPPEVRSEADPAAQPVHSGQAAPAAPAQVSSPPQPATGGNNGGTVGMPGRFVSPVVARIAAEHGVDPSQIPGTGSGGRVTKKDILAFIEGGGQPQSSAAAPAGQSQGGSSAPQQSQQPQQPQQPSANQQPSSPAPAAASPAPAAASAPASSGQAAPAAAAFSGGEQVVNFNPMRKAIARHMVDSVQTSPHVTSTMEVDMSRVVAMRGRLKGELEQQWGVKVTFTHFVVRALVDAIAHWPLINAEIRGESAVIKNYVNLGIAVALDGGEGLIVPVLKNAEEKNLVGLARGINDLATRARSKKLMPDDVSGGTFTLTNPGIFGAVHGTPIINQPQVAILDTEAIVKRPVVVTDADGADSIAIRSMMNLCMSYDHRLIDGAYAVQFLAHLKNSLQTWDEASFVG